MLNLGLLALLAAAGGDELADGPSTKTRIAVMKVNASGVPKEYAEGLTETLATQVSRTGVFDTVSPRQISSLLAFEKRKELLGNCLDDDCYMQVAKLVKAPHLIGGSVAKVGNKVALNLVLIDALEGKALNRVNREAAAGADLLGEVRSAAIVLLQPVLQARQGYLKVAVNVPGANVSVDDELRPEKSGQVIALSAGPHVLKVAQDGFYTATTDVFVRPSRVAVEEIKLIPAKETVADYEGSANLMRYAAWGTGGLAIAAGVASAIFYSRAGDDKQVVDVFNSSRALEQSQPGMREAALDARSGFQTNQALYLTFLGTGVIAAGTSLVLWLTGEDPDRYEEFHALTSE